MESNPSGRTLVLLRHGHSAANGADTVSGWLDVPLSRRGYREAARAGVLLAEHGCRPDFVHTSVLTRAVRTADLALAELGPPGPPVRRSWRLNERHYGALQGRTRDGLRAEYGAEQYALWRRSYRQAPPPLPVESPDDPRLDHRYAALPVAELPRTESLADVRTRLVPYWDDAIAPDLRAGRTTLVVAHGNSLRALCMHLDALTEGQVALLEIPTGVPLRYDLDADLRPVVPGGTYLDPVAGVGALDVHSQDGAR
ncbi:MAG: 2,3-bisphosphoglycerate-dependent phosphoglycerate mutase [Pseudonocardiales bacterium]|nr:2,3-bisphosphoglycerate-dependent phosphoglycerate mutase [Pseudonocardiales bacterium]